jgi:hypothetical protein
MLNDNKYQEENIMTKTSNPTSSSTSKEEATVLENKDSNKNKATKTTTTRRRRKTVTKEENKEVSLVSDEVMKLEETSKAEEIIPVETEVETQKAEEIIPVETEVETQKAEEIIPVETEVETSKAEEIIPVKTEVETSKAEEITPVKTEEKALEEAKDIIKKVNKDLTMEDKVLSSETVAEKKKELAEAKKKFKEAISKSVEDELARVENMEVISSQFNKTSDFVQNMLKRLEDYLEVAEVKGRMRVESVVDGVLGDNIVNDTVTKTLSYVGGKVSQGYTLGSSPAVAVGGAVRGVYKKIVE